MFGGEDDGGRQARVARRPRRGEARVVASFGGDVLVVEPGDVLLVQERRLEGVHGRSVRVPFGGGIDQDLQADLRSAGVARQKTDHRRQVGPGAVAHDHQGGAGLCEVRDLARHP